MFKPNQRSSEKRKHSKRSVAACRFAVENLESRTLMSATPIGSVDVFSRTKVVGWAFDVDDGPAALNIDITVNGVKSSVAANVFRADLSALGSPYHAFSFNLPALLPGNSNVLVEAVSPSTGVRKTLKSGVLTNPAP